MEKSTWIRSTRQGHSVTQISDQKAHGVFWSAARHLIMDIIDLPNLDQKQIERRHQKKHQWVTDKRSSNAIVWKTTIVLAVEQVRFYADLLCTKQKTL